MIVRFRADGLPRPSSAPPHTAHAPLIESLELWKSELRFFVKVSRPGFWLTSIWFYLLPLAPHWPLDSFAFWLGLFYVGFPLGMLIYAANDLTDEFTDRLNPRKDSFLFGARPTRDQIVELPWRIFLVQVPFLALFWSVMGSRALLWLVGAFLSSTLYNMRGGAKDRPGWDALSQVGYLLVFVLSCWLNNAPFSPWPIWVFGALFAMHSHLFGQIIDIAPDAAAGRRTTAVVWGPVRTKLLIALLLGIEAFIALSIPTKPWLTPFVGAGAIWFLLDAFWLWREHAYSGWQMRVFFLGWNMLLLVEILWSHQLLSFR